MSPSYKPCPCQTYINSMPVGGRTCGTFILLEYSQNSKKIKMKKINVTQAVEGKII